MAQYKTTKTFPWIGLEEGKSASCLFCLYPPLGNLEKWVLCFSLDLTEARSLLKITSLPVVSNSVSIVGPYFQPQYLVNTQFLDTLVSQVRWGHLEPWPHSLRIMDFWEVSTSSPSAWVLKGPCQVLKGVTIARIPTSRAPEGCSRQLAHIHTRNGWISVVLCVWSWLSSPG